MRRIPKKSQEQEKEWWDQRPKVKKEHGRLLAAGWCGQNTALGLAFMVKDASGATS